MTSNQLEMQTATQIQTQDPEQEQETEVLKPIYTQQINQGQLIEQNPTIISTGFQNIQNLGTISTLQGQGSLQGISTLEGQTNVQQISTLQSQANFQGISTLQGQGTFEGVSNGQGEAQLEGVLQPIYTKEIKEVHHLEEDGEVEEVLKPMSNP